MELTSTTVDKAPTFLIDPYFVRDGKCPIEATKWERREVPELQNGSKIYIDAPKNWSDRSVNIAAVHYIAKEDGASIRTMILRIVDTIKCWGRDDDVFKTREEAEIFRNELAYILVNRMGSFNSPVWYNLGLSPNPVLSACFLNTVEDDSESIAALNTREIRIFKSGAGSGCNWSKLRSKDEPVKGGSNSSGPLSFMIANDVQSNKWRSGGKHRRAARLDLLDIDHPDIVEFVDAKSKYEAMVGDLVKAGWSTDMMDPYSTSNNVPLQNTNLSVRISDEFMKAVEADEDWKLPYITKLGHKTIKAKELLRRIAEGAWTCGDPGVQFSDTINRWSTVSDVENLRSTNVCSEVFAPDNTACNLASMNLLPACRGPLTTKEISQISKVMITAQNILIDRANYPSKQIESTTRNYRPLGLGWCNLGAALMYVGFPYNSDRARNYAARVTSHTTAEAYLQSIEIAKRLGPFDRAHKCADSISRVLGMHHKEAREDLDGTSETQRVWEKVRQEISKGSLPRNCAVTCSMPTGTTGLLMDCDTTGIEPFPWLKNSKKLSYGGTMEMEASATIASALDNLRYENPRRLAREIIENGSAVGLVKDEHLAVFDTAMPNSTGRCLSPMGHLSMLKAIQPHISMGISKTVNLPNNESVEQMEQAIVDAWKMGIKSVAFYRDGSKNIQILNKEGEKAPETFEWGERQPLPDTRKSVTHKFELEGTEVYLTAGMYENGRLGEIWLVASKQGSTINGLLDSFAIGVSLALQYGAPLEHLADKFKNIKFSPQGWHEGHFYDSLVDYVFRWLDIYFCEETSKPGVTPTIVKSVKSNHTDLGDRQVCPQCGDFMIRDGKCQLCTRCGRTNGGCGG